MTEDQILGEISKAVAQIDSLDLAMLVREMEERVGHDPFQDGFIDFRTAGELAKLYVK
jgi:hypothetical protein